MTDTPLSAGQTLYSGFDFIKPFKPTSARTTPPVRELNGEFSYDARPGTFEIPFSHGRPCQVEIPEGCKVSGKIWIAETERDSEAPASMREFELKFSKPILFNDVVSTLREINSVFQDKELDAFLLKMSQMALPSLGATSIRDQLLKKLSDLTPGSQEITGDILRNLEQLGMVAPARLSRISGTPVYKNDGWHWVCTFSGSIRYFDLVSVPFTRVKLPSVILPSFHTSLDYLFSQDPLASARLILKNIPVRKLTEIMMDTVENLTASYRLRSTLPELTLSGSTLLQSRLNVATRSLSSFNLSGEFSSQRDGDAHHFRCSTTRDDTSRISIEGKILPEPLLAFLATGTEATEGKADGLQCKVDIQDFVVEDGFTSRIEISNPLVNGHILLPVKIHDIHLNGASSTTWKQGDCQQSGSNDFSFRMESLAGGAIENDNVFWQPTLKDGRFSGRLHWPDPSTTQLSLEGTVDSCLETTIPVADFPELNIVNEQLKAAISTANRINLQARLRNLPDDVKQIELSGTHIHITLQSGEMALAERTLTLPEGLDLNIEVVEGQVDSTGLGEMTLLVNWDSKGNRPVIRYGDQEVTLFEEEPDHGTVTVKIAPSGAISLSGEKQGVIHVGVLNALINPGVDPATGQADLAELLNNPEPGQVLIDIIALFSREWADKLRDIGKAVEHCRKVLEEEGVEEPRHMISNQDAARVFSKMLFGDYSRQEVFSGILTRFTEGDGIDCDTLKTLVNERWPDHDFAWELDQGLKWLNGLLSPGAPIPFPRCKSEPPLALNPAYQPSLADLPTAAEIYASIATDPLHGEGKLAKLAAVAPYLSLAQINYLMEQVKPGWPGHVVQHLGLIRDIKTRIELIGSGSGDLRYSLQHLTIAAFLGDVVTLEPFRISPENPQNHPVYQLDGVLGPRDIAILLHAGLIAPLPTPLLQINQRLLMDYIARQPASFLCEVLIEISSNDEKGLTGLLMALLEQDQEHIVDPLDLPAFFSTRLGLPAPIQRDFMASGRLADQSYFEAVSQLARAVVLQGRQYLAARTHLQLCRHPADVPQAPPTSQETALVEQAQSLILAADARGATWLANQESTLYREEAEEAYQEAVNACKQVISSLPYAIGEPWLKAFWHRNYESLMIRSIIQNYHDDIEEVRRWVHVRTGQDAFESDSELMDRLIETLYSEKEDIDQLKADPVMRLQMPPPKGKYHFTVVSGWGLISDGAKGTEMKAPMERLTATYGIEYIRSDTATMRQPDYNASKIIEAARKVKTPWGMIGLSQGCANSLRAETLLRGGTPDDQALLSGLRCRQLLVGAHNGAVVGSLVDRILRQATISAENILKHYQADYSQPIIQLALRVVRMMLQARSLVHFLAGFDSVSLEAAYDLGRECQHVGTVPTTTLMGNARKEMVSEFNMFCFNFQNRLTDNAPQDMQVPLACAVGYPVHVTNAYTEVLRRCDMGSTVQAWHHWSCLDDNNEQVRQVQTEKDWELALFQSPQDRHVFPWVEVNARFGLIEVREA